MTMRPRERFVPTLEHLESRDLMAVSFTSSIGGSLFDGAGAAASDNRVPVYLSGLDQPVVVENSALGASWVTLRNQQSVPTTPTTVTTTTTVTPPPPIIPPPPGGTGDWFDQNMNDAALRSLVRTLNADQNLNRADMLAVFAQASKDGTVSAAEFGDLGILVRNSAMLGMPEYVSVLSNKVVNGDAANATYLGAKLGNLQVGSTGTHLNNLVSKWFLGTDRPTAVDSRGRIYSYAAANGSLFVNGAAYSDVKQGGVADCYFLAALGETALRTPSAIQEMFIDNGDQTYTVRYFNNGVADYVTVDRYLPVSSAGTFVFASAGASAKSASNELWVALAEKAYAQLAASGWSRGSKTNSYGALNYGYIGVAFTHITGRYAAIGNGLDFNAVVSAWNAGQLVGFASKSSGTASNIVPSHAYALVGYNSTNQTFTLANPWGNASPSYPATVTLTWAQITASFSYWDLGT
jgi:hypothetical protein